MEKPTERQVQEYREFMLDLRRNYQRAPYGGRMTELESTAIRCGIDWLQLWGESGDIDIDTWAQNFPDYARQGYAVFQAYEAIPTDPPEWTAARDGLDRLDAAVREAGNPDRDFAGYMGGLAPVVPTAAAHATAQIDAAQREMKRLLAQVGEGDGEDTPDAMPDALRQRAADLAQQVRDASQRAEDDSDPLTMPFQQSVLDGMIALGVPESIVSPFELMIRDPELPIDLSFIPDEYLGMFALAMKTYLDKVKELDGERQS